MAQESLVPSCVVCRYLAMLHHVFFISRDFDFPGTELEFVHAACCRHWHVQHLVQGLSISREETNKMYLDVCKCAFLRCLELSHALARGRCLRA